MTVVASHLPCSSQAQDAASARETGPAESLSETAHYLSLTSGPVKLSIDPKIGGRIASMTYDGQEILKTSRDENNWHWGSTIWVGPQSDWGWPPSTAIDSDPYDVVSADESKIVLRGKQDSVTGYQITKRFEFLAKAERPIARMVYTVHNQSDETKKVALWENTRVVWDGVTRFPAGTKIRLAKADQPIVMRDQKLSIAIPLDDQQPDAQKVFCTPPAPEGGKMTWNSYRLGDLVLTKSRKAPGEVGPGQSPLEIYFGRNAGFAELEYQGPYVELPPGGRSEMVVLWRLRKADP
jgi:hypothetical protein